jgi:hypothetical protein
VRIRVIVEGPPDLARRSLLRIAARRFAEVTDTEPMLERPDYGAIMALRALIRSGRLELTFEERDMEEDIQMPGDVV